MKKLPKVPFMRVVSRSRSRQADHRVRVAVGARVAEFLGFTVALLSLASCTGLVAAGPAINIAEPIVRAVVTHDVDDSGKFVAHLSDGRTFEGRWYRVTRYDAPAAIQTPRGRITSADLTTPHYPRFVSEVNGPGASVRMICAFVGDAYSGYQGRCIENTGTEWTGAFGKRNWPAGGYSIRAVVSLHEVARCPPCDEEVDDGASHH